MMSEAQSRAWFSSMTPQRARFFRLLFSKQPPANAVEAAVQAGYRRSRYTRNTASRLLNDEWRYATDEHKAVFILALEPNETWREAKLQSLAYSRSGAVAAEAQLLLSLLWPAKYPPQPPPAKKPEHKEREDYPSRNAIRISAAQRLEWNE